MKIKSTSPLLLLVLAISIPCASAADRYWKPAVLSGNWDTATANWAATPAGPANQFWSDGDNAFFQQAGTYSVNLTAAFTAGTLTVGAGNVSLTGAFAVASDSVSIANGATLITKGTRIAKSGNTPVTVNGTLDLSEGPSGGGTYLQFFGNGIVIGIDRHAGDANFAGNFVDPTSPVARAGITWNGGSAGTFTLSGNNNGMTGDILLGFTGSVIKLASPQALGVNTYVRFEGGGGALELASNDLTRVWAPGSNASNGTGGIRFSGNGSIIYPTGADRNFTLVTTAGGTTSADVVWGLNGLEGSVGLGAPAATRTITWTNNIDLNLAPRSIRVGDGDADVDAILSGVISGVNDLSDPLLPKISKLIKSGPGTLLLTNANTHEGGTAIAASPFVDSALRITDPAALGAGPLTIGGGGNDDQALLQISGGITITNPIDLFTSRNSDAPNIVNLSGDNSIDSNMGSGGGGDRTTFQSNAGKLTLNGNFNGRTLNLTGAGNGLFTNAVNLGIYGLNKRDAGTWTLSGTVTYSGNTRVEGGTLSVPSAFLDDASSVFIEAGASLKLDYTGTDTVAALTLGPNAKGPGIYDSTTPGGFITGNGKIQVVPTAGDYATWATANGIDGEPASGDFDFDGLSNFTEYALGLNPTKSSVPAGTFANGEVTFTKGADAIANGDVNYVIQESDDLGITDPWTAVVTQNAPDASLTISYTLPSGKSKVFTRLKVTQAP